MTETTTAPLCPRCDIPVEVSIVTSDYAFCGQCGGGPWPVATLPTREVAIAAVPFNAPLVISADDAA